MNKEAFNDVTDRIQKWLKRIANVGVGGFVFIRAFVDSKIFRDSNLDEYFFDYLSVIFIIIGIITFAIRLVLSAIRYFTKRE